MSSIRIKVPRYDHEDLKKIQKLADSTLNYRVGLVHVGRPHSEFMIPNPRHVYLPFKAEPLKVERWNFHIRGSKDDLESISNQINKLIQERLLEKDHSGQVVATSEFGVLKKVNVKLYESFEPEY